MLMPNCLPGSHNLKKDPGVNGRAKLEDPTISSVTFLPKS